MNLKCRLIGDADPATDRSEDLELRIAHIACLFVLPLYIPSAWAEPAPTELPGGGQVSAGQASINVKGSRMDVNQTSQNAGIDWQTFNIGSDAQVDFHQPDATAVAVNRIADPNGSQIMGKLNANGQIYLINPNGVLFGKGSQVNVGGLVASTLDTADGNTAADRRRTFAATGGSGKIVNQGAITAADGGYVALLGEHVSNQGVIQAKLGTVALAAGDKITLEFAGDKLLDVEVDKGALQALAENKQLIQADGGMVLMTAKAADALLSTVVNNEGVIEARTVEDRNGVIKLLGDMDSGTVNVGGTLDASAQIPPSPPFTKGGIDIAGTTVSTSPPFAKGGRGGFGFIETSAAHVKIADDAVITTKAENGQSGTWLIDPVDFTIASGSGALTTSGIGASTLSTNLGNGNVSIATDASTGGNGDIFVNSAVSWAANKLTLTAHRNIAINADLNGSGTASLALEYGQASAGGGGSNYSLSGGAKVNLPAGLNFSTKLGTGGATIDHTVITSLGVEGDATVAPGVMTLQGMNTGLAGNYVLGADIAASGTSSWNTNAGFVPVGTNGSNFTGSFDGLGHTVTGLTINRQVNVVANFYQGLFGYATGALRNVGMLNSNIAGANIVGALAGYSGGSISYSYADGGSVTASVHQAGGLVGQLGGGSISNSYANVSVSGTDYACCGGGVASSNIGGLVGKALTGSSISNSYSTGSVNGNTYVGGLVGQSNANIDTSYASGAVTKAGGASRGGGLIGDHLGGTISNSYWDSFTTGQGGTGGCSGGGCTGIVASLTDITAAPYAQASYTGLDFAGSWRIYEGNTRPLLKNFLTSLTVTANNATKTYNGLAYSGGNGVSYSTAPNANLLGTVSYGGTSQGAINVGSYVITPSALYSNQRGYDITYANGALTVNTAPLTVTAGSVSKTYNGLAWSGNNGVGYSGFVNGETSAVLGGALAYGGSSQGAINTGSYAITPSGLTSSNYAITFASGSLTVNPAALTVTASGFSKTYDGLAYSGGNGVGYSGFVNGETSAVLGGMLAYGGSSQGAVNAGSYAITPSGLTASNYAITFASGNLTVNPAALTVTANGFSKIYDGLAYSGGDGISYSGFVNGETASVLGGALAYGGSSQGAVNAGSYAITPSGLTSGNYAISYANGALTVNTAPLAVTATAASKIYDGLAYSGGNGVGYSGFVNGESTNVLGGSLAYGGNAQGAVNAGSYIITPSGLTSSNYAITYGSANLAITPATLTYAATPASFFSGQIPSGLSGTVNGFAAGDTLANSTTGSLAWTSTVDGFSQSALYPINGGGLLASNYVFVQAAGNATALTLNPSRPPQPVSNAMALLESDMLSTPAPDPSPAITSSFDTAGGDSDSLPESGNSIVQNTGMSAAMNTGQINRGLTIVQPGVKLPDNRVHIDE